jgi:hypothetical protein
MENEAAELAPYELAALAGQHGTSEERVRRLIADSGSHSRREIEEALELARTTLRQYTAF